MLQPCIYCGRPASTIDHIIPRCAGGTDAPSNRAPACQGCNSRKGRRSVERFLEKYSDILARVRRHQAGHDVLTGLEPGEPPYRGATVSLSFKLTGRSFRRLRSVVSPGLCQNEVIEAALDEYLTRQGA